MKRLSLVGALAMVIIFGFGAMAWAGEASVFDNVQNIIIRVSTICTSGCGGATPTYSAKLGAWDTEGGQFVGSELSVTKLLNGTPAQTYTAGADDTFLIHDNNLTSPDVSMSFDKQTGVPGEGITYVFCTEPNPPTGAGLHMMKFHVVYAGAAPQPVAGVCGSSNNQSFYSKPTTNLCGDGSLPTVSGTGPWTWTCAGQNGGAPANCTANKKVDGVCGSSGNGTFTSAPTTNLCGDGSLPTVSGTGPWTWTCAGQNGGTNASCTAQLQSTGSPDLTVTAFSGMPSSYAAGYIYNFNVTVKNIGTASSGSFSLKIYENNTYTPGGNVLFSQSISLNPGESYTITKSLAATEMCTIHTYCYYIAVADADNVVIESNEWNNKLSLSSYRTR